MALDIFDNEGTPLDQQRFTWRELAPKPISKLDVDAFTRVRIILMNGIECEASRFSHACARMNKELQLPLALVRRVEQHQATLVNWLLPADQSPLETTIGYEQVAIEVTASLAQQEPDPYIAQVMRFGLLEDFDHLYRYTALLDRMDGKDANNILQCYSDIMPGRPTAEEHRHPADDLRDHYDKRTADPLTKLNSLTIMAGEHQTHDYYMNIGPMFADPLARQLEFLIHPCAGMAEPRGFALDAVHQNDADPRERGHIQLADGFRCQLPPGKPLLFQWRSFVVKNIQCHVDSSDYRVSLFST